MYWRVSSKGWIHGGYLKPQPRWSRDQINGKRSWIIKVSAYSVSWKFSKLYLGSNVWGQNAWGCEFLSPYKCKCAQNIVKGIKWENLELSVVSPLLFAMDVETSLAQLPWSPCFFKFSCFLWNLSNANSARFELARCFSFLRRKWSSTKLEMGNQSKMLFACVIT